MKKNYTVYHLHDDTSNCNGFADSCTKYDEYIKLAKKCDMKSIAFSNHGGIYDWIKKKQCCDKNKIKYIHGVELYLCINLQDNTRGYHIGLYAKNFDGVLELNTLMSKATSKGVKEDKSDRHMYYNPRISFDELMSTSENIIITTACLASALWRLGDKAIINEENGEEKHKYNIQKRTELLEWMSKNNKRCFLEIQYHKCTHQVMFNKSLYEWSKQYNIPLIAGTDTHSSNKYKAECRTILQKAKDSFYGEEDEFDLIWKTYDELIEKFKEQNSLPMDIVIEAIENTNKLSDMIEEFTLDKSFKYPTLYGDNAKLIWKNRIFKMLKDKKEKNIIDVNRLEEYKNAILEEFKVMSKLGMESFMMFMSELMEWARENNIHSSPCRGSVGGSVIAFITDIITVDPIRWNTVFSRFCNEDRISLGDIDEDFSPKDRIKVYQYIIDRFGNKNVSYILTLNTIQDRGSIDVLAKGLDYKDLSIVKNIKNQFDDIFEEYSKIIQEEVNLEELAEEENVTSKSPNFDDYKLYISRIRNKDKSSRVKYLKFAWDKLREDNKELFYYFDGIKGTVIAKGNHPSGMIGSPITLCDNIGVFYKGGDEDFPVSFCAMKSVDSLNYVKFDILGLKTIGIIQDTYKLLNKEWENTHEIDWNDDNVWNDMILNNAGIFQFEGRYAFDLLNQFKPHAINDMSLVNASLRPSGKSYRNRLMSGEFNKNPSKQIDDLLKENKGFLIFQEDTIKFLTNICGFSGSLADTTRRCIDEDSLIMLGNGNFKKIKDIKIGDNVQSFNNINISEHKKITNVFNNGTKKAYLITTNHNYELIATDNHKVLSQRGWIEIKDLTTNDFIMTPKNINPESDDLQSNKRLKNTDMYLLGLLIGDGTLGKNNNIHFTNSENVLIDEFKKCINNRLRNNNECEFYTIKQNGVEVDYVYSVYIKSKNYKDSVINLLEKYDLRKSAAKKHIPNEIMSYPCGEKIISLLAGLFNTDGGYNSQQSMIEYYSTSYILTNQIKSLLHKYNIYSYIQKKFVPEYNYFSYTLTIRQIDSLNKFKNIILPYIIGKKHQEFTNIIYNANNKENKFNYLLPNECKNEILDMSQKTHTSILSVGEKIGVNKSGLGVHKTEFGIGDLKAKSIIQHLYCPETYKLLFSDYIPVKVKNIKFVGCRNVYDIEVEDNHNYVANGLIVHNCIGKKDIDGLKEQLPKILEGYCNKSNKSRELAEKEAKQFIQIISDSSEYQFGYNHSTGYSMNGYMCARLRYYYPLEFTTAYLNNAENQDDIDNGTALAKFKNINIQNPKFRYSKGEYMCDTESNTIYKGVSSIKYLNDTCANQLYDLRDNNYKTFLDLLKDITENVNINSRQLTALIYLDYFSEFGKSKKLLDIYNIYTDLSSRKQFKKADLKNLGLSEELLKKYSKKETEKIFKEVDIKGLINELTINIEDKSLSLKEKISSEIEYLGYPITKLKTKGFYYVTQIDEFKNKKSITRYLTMYDLQTDEQIKYKLSDFRLFSEQPIKENQLIKITEESQKPKKYKDENGKWQTKKDEFNFCMDSWQCY